MIVNFRHRKGVLHATTGTLSTARVAALLIVIVQPAAALGSRTVRPDEARDHAMRGISSAKVGNLPQAERELQQAVRMAPGVAQYHAQLASILGLQGKWKPALESFEKAIDLAPGNLDFRRETAAVQWQLGLMSSAEKNLQYVLTRHPQDSGSILLLGMVKEKTGDYAKAAELLNAQFALVSSQPDRVVAMFHSVVESRQSEKIEKIVEVLKLHANDSSWSAAISQCTQLAAMGGDVQTARTLFSLLPNTEPTRVPAALHVAKLMYDHAQIGQAKQLLLQLEEQGVVSADLETLLGNCYESERRPDLALSAYQRAIRVEPTRVDYYEDLISLLLYLHKTDDALAQIQQAMAVAPYDARPWVWKGNVDLRRNSPLEAMASYKHAIKLDSKNPDAVLGVATVYFTTGRTDEAIVGYKVGISHFPNDARFYVACAEMLLASPDPSKHRPEAEQLLKKAIELTPQSSEAYFLLGKSAMEQGRFQDAEAEFLHSLECDSDRSKTHFALSGVYRRMGRAEDAAKEFALYEKLKKAEEGEGTSALGPMEPE